MILKNGKFLPDFETMEFYDNKIWFSEWNCNELYYYDLDSKNVELFVKLETEETYGDRLFGAIIICNGYIYLFPFLGKNIYKINIVDRNVITISNFPVNGILSAHLYENHIFMISGQFPSFYDMDCETDEIRAYSQWGDMLNNVSLTDDNAYFRKTFLKDGKVYAPLTKGNAIVVFDIMNKTFDVHIVGEKGDSFSSICYDGENFWLAPRKLNNIILWNEEKDFSKKYKFEDLDMPSFGDIVLIHDEIYLLPFGGKNVIALDKCTRNIKKVNNTDMGRVCKCIRDDMIFLFSSQRHKLYIYHQREKSYEEDTIALDTLDMEYLNQSSAVRKILTNINEAIKYGKIIFGENYKNALQDYIHLIDKTNQFTIGDNGEIGENIYRTFFQ